MSDDPLEVEQMEVEQMEVRSKSPQHPT